MTERRIAPNGYCSVDGCDRPVRCLGVRRKHREEQISGLNLRSECFYLTCTDPVARSTSLYCSGNCRSKHYQAYRTFGVLPTEYNDALEYQDCKCAICHRHESEIRRLCIDHDHDTGLLRGLLCDDCNMAIGLLKDQPERVVRAAEYLINSSKVHDIDTFLKSEGVGGYSLYSHSPERSWSEVVQEIMKKDTGRPSKARTGSTN